jgi:hypothetical protein
MTGMSRAIHCPCTHLKPASHNFERIFWFLFFIGLDPFTGHGLIVNFAIGSCLVWRTFGFLLCNFQAMDIKNALIFVISAALETLLLSQHQPNL